MKQDSWIYVAGEPGSDRCKVGITGDLDARRTALGHGAGAPVVLFYSSQVLMRPRLIEIEAHRLLRQWRGHGEWFQCSPLKAAIAIRRARIGLANKTNRHSLTEFRRMRDAELDRIIQLAELEWELTKAENRTRLAHNRVSKLRAEMLADQRTPEVKPRFRIAAGMSA